MAAAQGRSRRGAARRHRDRSRCSARCSTASSSPAPSAAYGVEVIYHAAAYKHVPDRRGEPVHRLAEQHVRHAVVAEVAKEAGVERFVLVSSDKAVRPDQCHGREQAARRADPAGAGRRSADAHRSSPWCASAMCSIRRARWCRRFRNQIKAGGPVTVTHPEVIRYFMSIPEAAQLVIQAGTMASGGEVFVLDMGTPVKIDDLARTMVRLSGLEVRDDEQPRRRHRHRICRAPARREALRGASDRREHDRHQPPAHLQELRADAAL